MNLTELLQKHGAKIAPQGNKYNRPNWTNIVCPFCGHLYPDKYHCGINNTFGTVNCYNCGPGKSLKRVLQKVSSSSYKELSDDVGKIKWEKYKETGLNTGFKYTEPDFVGELKKGHIEYLKSRRLNVDEIVKIWNLKGIGIAPRLSWRIFIPIYFQGKKVSWTTRSIGKAGYMSASKREETIDHKQILYGEDYAGETICVHEGPFDVITTGPGAVGTLGIGYTQSQLIRIGKHPNRYICFDNQPSAIERAKNLKDELSIFGGKTSILIIDAKDINEASDKERRLLRRTVFGKKH